MQPNWYDFSVKTVVKTNFVSLGEVSFVYMQREHELVVKGKKEEFCVVDEMKDGEESLGK